MIAGSITPEDSRAVSKARRAGCRPQWYDGIIGWAWHCGCKDRRHAYDSQCSVLKYYRKGG